MVSSPIINCVNCITDLFCAKIQIPKQFAIDIPFMCIVKDTSYTMYYCCYKHICNLINIIVTYILVVYCTGCPAMKPAWFLVNHMIFISI